ncbi:PQ-loop domain-containing transporter [Flavobacterium sinopsychrotolerans]|uniref:PQ loop repeat-containing protein n=1 Tax=Flavobacterium sinopsychrotolerans TaxID=604089 RepID=A0A1H8LCJ7_9FLAO|nr:PQ loop repeat-containing protein [Flavobacterium sinopsychrotolerans]
MEYGKILGLVGAAIATGADFPQTYNIHKIKSTKDSSVITCVLLLEGRIMWTAFRIFGTEIPETFVNEYMLRFPPLF